MNKDNESDKKSIKRRSHLTLFKILNLFWKIKKFKNSNKTHTRYKCAFNSQNYAGKSNIADLFCF